MDIRDSHRPESVLEALIQLNAQLKSYGDTPPAEKDRQLVRLKRKPKRPER